MVSMNFQIGKSGLTPGVMESLRLAAKNHSEVRISILKSADRDKELVKRMALDIEKSLDFPCKCRVLGYTIILRKSRSGRK